MTTARTTEYRTRDGRVITMTQIGRWLELATYWRGSDGNAWTHHSCSGAWTNNGPADTFRERFGTAFRGQLFEETPCAT
jgi:hypothetical protein